MNDHGRRLPRCASVDEWSEEDQRAWAAATKSGDILDEAGLAGSWRATTMRKVEEAVGQFLGWAADEAGSPLAPTPTLATTTALREYIAWLQPRVAPFTVLGLIVDLGQYFRVAWPDWSRTDLMRAERRLRWTATPSRDKRSRLRPASELVHLGQTLMDTMEETSFADPRLALVRYRDGLAIALLALLPLRIRAFASIRLGENLVRRGEGWRIVITPDLSKTHRFWEADVPKALALALERYLEEIRPKLLAARGRWYRDPGAALWISKDGSALKPKALGEAIAKHTAAAFGEPISPHMFRDCAATTLALDSPENVRLATPLLGHAHPATTEKHYNQARSVDAGRKHIEALRRLRGRRSRAPGTALPGRR